MQILPYSDGFASLQPDADDLHTRPRSTFTQRRNPPNLERKAGQSQLFSLPFHSVIFKLGKGHAQNHSDQTTRLYQAFLHGQQVGGRVGVPVVLGGHQVRTFQRVCALEKYPSALLFIDLQEAFYRVVRPLILAGPLDDDLIATTAARIGLDEGFLHDLHAALMRAIGSWIADAPYPSYQGTAYRHVLQAPYPRRSGPDPFGHEAR